MRTVVIVAILCIFTLPPIKAGETWNVYFGNLHCHSGISDGQGTPAEAFEYARDFAKDNFLCLSEHNHLRTTQAGLAEVMQAAQESTKDDFVGLVGQEYSVIKKGNHVNVYDVWEQIPASLNSNYREFFHTWLIGYKQRNPQANVVCQFNHPENPEADYGIKNIDDIKNYDGKWDKFLADVGPWVRTIAIISGPADSDRAMNLPPLIEQHQDVKQKYLNAWFTYLDKGFRLAPVADQDNHRKTWGKLHKNCPIE